MKKSTAPPSIHAKCWKTSEGSQYGMLICSRSKGHTGKCHDVDNDVWFVPEDRP